MSLIVFLRISKFHYELHVSTDCHPCALEVGPDMIVALAEAEAAAAWWWTVAPLGFVGDAFEEGD